MELIINDSKWSIIYPILQKQPKIHRKNEKSLRKFVNAILWINQTGAQWEALPKEFGKPNSVRRRFARWAKLGVLKEVLEVLTAKANATQIVCIDATFIKAHVLATGQHNSSSEKECFGRSVGGLTTKIHALVDGKGRPMNFLFSPGQEHEINKAPGLVESVKSGVTVIADKGYDSDDFIKLLRKYGRENVIPPRSSRRILRDCDKEVYKKRNMVERFFGKLKVFRRVCTRYDRTIVVFAGFVTLAAIRMWLN